MPPSLPPGLSAGGVTDGFALADAHAAALANTSFTVRVRHTLAAADGTVLGRSTGVRRVAAGHERVATWLTSDGPLLSFLSSSGRVDRIDRWFNGTHWRYRVQGPDGFVHAAVDPVGTPDLTDARALRSYYLNAATERVHTACDPLALVLRLPPDRQVAATVPRVNATDVTVVLSLTGSGRVTQYRVFYAGRLVDSPGTQVRGVRTVAFVSVGSTTVDRPAWVDAAGNGTVGAGE